MLTGAGPLSRDPRRFVTTETVVQHRSRVVRQGDGCALGTRTGVLDVCLRLMAGPRVSWPRQAASSNEVEISASLFVPLLTAFACSTSAVGGGRRRLRLTPVDETIRFIGSI